MLRNEPVVVNRVGREEKDHHRPTIGPCLGGLVCPHRRAEYPIVVLHCEWRKRRLRRPRLEQGIRFAGAREAGLSDRTCDGEAGIGDAMAAAAIHRGLHGGERCAQFVVSEMRCKMSCVELRAH